MKDTYKYILNCHCINYKIVSPTDKKLRIYQASVSTFNFRYYHILSFFSWLATSTLFSLNHEGWQHTIQLSLQFDNPTNLYINIWKFWFVSGLGFGLSYVRSNRSKVYLIKLSQAPSWFSFFCLSWIIIKLLL